MRITRDEFDRMKDEGIINGFGPRNSPILHWLLNKISPEFKEASADWHDLGYYQGGSELRRFECDLKFYAAMISDCQHIESKWYYSLIAFIYFIAVRALGWKFFQYK